MIKVFHGTTSKRASKIVGNENYPQEGFSVKAQEAVFFSEDIKTAEFFASQRTSDESASQHLAGNGHMAPKALTVIEFTVPVALADELGIGLAHRSLLGEHSDMPFPDLADSSGYERILVGVDKVSKFNAKLASGAISFRRLRVERRGTSDDSALF